MPQLRSYLDTLLSGEAHRETASYTTGSSQWSARLKIGSPPRFEPGPANPVVTKQSSFCLRGLRMLNLILKQALAYKTIFGDYSCQPLNYTSWSLGTLNSLDLELVFFTQCAIF